MNRRSFVAAGSAAVAQSIMPVFASADALSQLEQKSGGRLGVAALDTGTGKRILHRADERFAMCSTFKLLLAATVLHRVDAGDERFDRPMAFGPGILLTHSPVTSAHLGKGEMSVGALCEAAVTQSDNGAANLLLTALGGPRVVTLYAESLGDNVTRLDRPEPVLNEVAPGDERDTTSPLAMLNDLRKIFLSGSLSDSSRTRLEGWARNCQTGKNRLRAGLPSDWVIGDKTGSWDGVHNATNDIAIAWPPKRAPILITAYYAGSPLPAQQREAVLAEVGRIVAKEFS